MSTDADPLPLLAPVDRELLEQLQRAGLPPQAARGIAISLLAVVAVGSMFGPTWAEELRASTLRPMLAQLTQALAAEDGTVPLVLGFARTAEIAAIVRDAVTASESRLAALRAPPATFVP